MSRKHKEEEMWAGKSDCQLCETSWDAWKSHDTSVHLCKIFILQKHAIFHQLVCRASKAGHLFGIVNMWSPFQNKWHSAAELLECACQYAQVWSITLYYSGGFTLPCPWVRHEGLLATALMKRKHHGFLHCFSMINTVVSGLGVIIGLLCLTLNCYTYSHRTSKIQSRKWIQTSSCTHIFHIISLTSKNLKPHLTLCLMLACITFYLILSFKFKFIAFITLFSCDF